MTVWWRRPATSPTYFISEGSIHVMQVGQICIALLCNHSVMMSTL
jgi:hypothetical protein